MMVVFQTDVRTQVQIANSQHQEAEPRASLWLAKNVSVQEERLSQRNKVENNRGRHKSVLIWAPHIQGHMHTMNVKKRKDRSKALLALPRCH